jgi:hypothetical protein
MVPIRIRIPWAVIIVAGIIYIRVVGIEIIIDINPAIAVPNFHA